MENRSLWFFSICTIVLLGVVPLVLKTQKDAKAKITAKEITTTDETTKTVVVETAKESKKEIPAKPAQPAAEKVATKTPAKKDVTEPKKVASAEKRTLTITNGITKEMLGYKYFGTHYPTTFSVSAHGTTLLSVNNSDLKALKKKGDLVQEKSEKVTFAGDKLVVRFDFDFLEGKKVGAREVTFTVKPDVKDLKMTFNWQKDDWHLTLDQATPEAIKEIA